MRPRGRRPSEEGAVVSQLLGDVRMGSFCSTSSPALVWWLCDGSHSSRCEVVLLLNSHLSDD